jgi:threonine aldolase
MQFGRNCRNIGQGCGQARNRAGQLFDRRGSRPVRIGNGCGLGQGARRFYAHGHAIRALASRGNRVIVQERSHIYQDMGDALSSLSGFNLIPLGHHRAHYTLEEASIALADSGQTRVKTGIGALVIESPVRRCHGEVFDFGEMSRLTSWARENGIGTHLDGARLFIASHYTKIPAWEYAALFDTVYVSLYKYFGAPSGAVLAGPAALLDGMYHERRMFGGGLNQAWIFAGLALDALPRFDVEFAEAVRISETLIGQLADSGVFVISRIPNGSNIFVLELVSEKVDAAGFSAALRKRGILLPEPVSGRYYLKVNTSLCGYSAEEICADYLAAASEA